MTETSYHPNPARIEPDDRLVILARTIEAPDDRAERALRDDTLNWGRFGRGCLGQALYRHGSVHRSASDAPVWSHFELGYFRNSVPAEVIRDLVTGPDPAETGLLRAEILLPTPSSFVLPRDWAGSADRPEWRASLEYIDVHPRSLGDYRDAMRDFCGPAAAKLVGAGRFGTFRAMETAAVLYHAPDFDIDWNQVHLCELDPERFEGFGREFEAALRGDAPDGAFADLARMRTVPRWTFNDAVVGADSALAAGYGPMP